MSKEFPKPGEIYQRVVSATCRGETCRMCGLAPATHKVGEEIPHDLPQLKHRDKYTAYVCCGCFGKIMGPAEVCWHQQSEQSSDERSEAKEM